jgi:hypothetical protein
MSASMSGSVTVTLPSRKASVSVAPDSPVVQMSPGHRVAGPGSSPEPGERRGGWAAQRSPNGGGYRTSPSMPSKAPGTNSRAMNASPENGAFSRSARFEENPNWG